MDTQLATRSKVLQIAFGMTATLAGLDKFFNLLADWPTYLSPLVLNIVPLSADLLMRAVGIIEIGVGVCILFAAPILGTYIASVWLLAVAVNLVLAGHFDVAVRDVVLAIAAFTLARSLELRATRPAASQADRSHAAQLVNTPV
jgi:uncharacterized membrane protein YphA (DoxX/SURF4 family)